jgi:hypothetical protein
MAGFGIRAFFLPTCLPLAGMSENTIPCHFYREVVLTRKRNASRPQQTNLQKNRIVPVTMMPLLFLL